MSEQAAEAVVLRLEVADDASSANAAVRVGGLTFTLDLRGEPGALLTGWGASATDQEVEEAARKALEAYLQELVARGVDEGWRERNREYWERRRSEGVRLFRRRWEA